MRDLRRVRSGSKKKKKKSEELDAVAFYWSARGPPDPPPPFLASTEKQASTPPKPPTPLTRMPTFFPLFFVTKNKTEKNMSARYLKIFVLVLSFAFTSSSQSFLLDQNQSINPLKHRQALDVVCSREEDPRGAVREAPERSPSSFAAAVLSSSAFAFASEWRRRRRR